MWIELDWFQACRNPNPPIIAENPRWPKSDQVIYPHQFSACQGDNLKKKLTTIFSNIGIFQCSWDSLASGKINKKLMHNSTIINCWNNHWSVNLLFQQVLNSVDISRNNNLSCARLLPWMFFLFGFHLSVILEMLDDRLTRGSTTGLSLRMSGRMRQNPRAEHDAIPSLA